MEIAFYGVAAREYFAASKVEKTTTGQLGLLFDSPSHPESHRCCNGAN